MSSDRRQFQSLDEGEEAETTQRVPRSRKQRVMESLALSRAIAVCTGLAIVVVVVVFVIAFSQKHKQRTWRTPAGVVTHIPVPSSSPSHGSSDISSETYAKFLHLFREDSKVSVPGSTQARKLNLRLLPLTDIGRSNEVRPYWKNFTYFNEFNEPVWLLHVRSGGTRIVADSNNITKSEEFKVTEANERVIRTCQQIDIRGLPTLHIVGVAPYIQEEASNANLVNQMTLSSCQKFSTQCAEKIPDDCHEDCSTCTLLLVAYDHGARSYKFPAQAGIRIGKTTKHESLLLSVEYHIPEDLDVPNNGWLDSSGFILYVTPTLRAHDTLPVRWATGNSRGGGPENVWDSKALYYTLQKQFWYSANSRLYTFLYSMRTDLSSAKFGVAQPRRRPAIERKRGCNSRIASELSSLNDYESIGVGGVPGNATSDSSSFIPIGLPLDEIRTKMPKAVVNSGSPEDIVSEFVTVRYCNDEILCQSSAVSSYYWNEMYEPLTLRSGDALFKQCGDTEEKSTTCTLTLYIYPIRGKEELAPPISQVGSLSQEMDEGVWYDYSQITHPVEYSKFWANYYDTDFSSTEAPVNLTCDVSTEKWTIVT